MSNELGFYACMQIGAGTGMIGLLIPGTFITLPGLSGPRRMKVTKATITGNEAEAEDEYLLALLERKSPDHEWIMTSQINKKAIEGIKFA